MNRVNSRYDDSTINIVVIIIIIIIIIINIKANQPTIISAKVSKLHSVNKTVSLI